MSTKSFTLMVLTLECSMDYLKFIKTRYLPGPHVPLLLLPRTIFGNSWQILFNLLHIIAWAVGTDLENTFQFVDEISSIDVSAVTMISFDVKLLFTNVPLKKFIKVYQSLFRSPLSQRPKHQAFRP